MELNKTNTNGLPKILAVIGQSGSGKGSTIEIIRSFYHDRGDLPMFISISKLIKENLSFSNNGLLNKIADVYKNGGIHPNIVALSFCFIEILKKHTTEKIIIIDGLPRHREQFLVVKSLVDQKYLDSFTVLEIKTSYQNCKNRLVERTRNDKRIDLSIDGKPGEIDYEKIKNKMTWWTLNRRNLVYAIKKHGMYISVENNGTLDELKEKILKII